jgi:uncharacterized membrane protein YdjX (TVP38/TMEM64 family)
MRLKRHWKGCMKMGWLKSQKFWLLLLGSILLVVLGKALPLGEWSTALRGWLGTLGPGAVPVFILVYLIASVFGLPNILLILAAGTLFGFLKGVISASIADTLGAIACFWLGRTIARDWVEKKIKQHPSFAQLDQAIHNKGWKILLLTRLSPLVPSNVLNYGFSCTNVNFWQYCFFSWLGMLPVIVTYIYLGSFGMSFLKPEPSPGKIALQAIGLVLTVSAAIYVTRTLKKSLSH